MAKTRKMYPGEVRTWIKADDMVKFKEIARARGLKDVDLAREFILNGLAVQEADLKNRLESEYAQQLKLSTEEITGVIKTGVNRICAMLAKVAVATLASNKYLARLEDTEDIMKDCLGAAAKQVHAGLTEDEKSIAQSMTKKMG